MTTLFCGHEPTKTDLPCAGYAINVAGETFCYSCADAGARKAMAGAKTFTAYLSGCGTKLTTWTGGTLARISRLTKVTRYGFGGRYYAVTFRAESEDGAYWYGTSPGRGMLARMHRFQGRVR